MLVATHHFRRRDKVEARERVQRLAQHLERHAGHAPDLHRARLLQAIGRIDKLGHARDLGRLVADAFQVSDGLDHGHQHAQIAGSGLAARDDGREVEVDLGLELFGCVFVVHHHC